jgi:hypothetical protein
MGKLAGIIHHPVKLFPVLPRLVGEMWPQMFTLSMKGQISARVAASKGVSAVCRMPKDHSILC